MATIPSTPALRALRAAGVAFDLHPYRYEPRGGTRASSQELGVDEHQVVKTLIFETEARAPLVVLMHGDAEVSQKALARHVGVKSVRPCAPEVAERHSGYRVAAPRPSAFEERCPSTPRRPSSTSSASTSTRAPGACSSPFAPPISTRCSTPSASPCARDRPTTTLSRVEVVPCTW